MLNLHRFNSGETYKDNPFGQEVQMDSCEKMRFGGIISYLHFAVDKGTKKFYLDDSNMND